VKARGFAAYADGSKLISCCNPFAVGGPSFGSRGCHGSEPFNRRADQSARKVMRFAKNAPQLGIKPRNTGI
jgi:hypothetical protein